MIVLIDNYDSFTYNLKHRIGEQDPSLEVAVYRNDEITVGKIRSLGDIARAYGQMRPMMFRFGSDDAAEADLLLAKLKEAGRDPVQSKDGFTGPAAPVARIRTLLPDAWAFSPEEARQCASDYVLTGWYGSLPASCKGGTMLIPVDEQWKYWGWPNRLIQRMEEQGGTVIVTGPDADYDALTGLTLPEQLGEHIREAELLGEDSVVLGFGRVDEKWLAARQSVGEETHG